MSRSPASDDPTLPGRPDAHGLEARLALAELRGSMFGRSAPIEVAGYRIERLIGRGAQGSVFEAVDHRLRRRVAIKIVRPAASVSDVGSACDRLLREARAMAHLDHPHVVAVYAAGVARGQVWIAMELVRGRTLAAWARDNRVDSAAAFHRAGELLAQAARGLAAAHARGLVHRDFKPANVLVGDDGRVRVADFGLARPRGRTGDAPAPVRAPEQPFSGAGSSEPGDGVTTTRFAGTPRYMSPEQLAGRRVDARSDQFNFAITAWELMHGVAPFGGETTSERLAAIEARALDEPRASPVPRAYTRALRRALSADPDDRFPSMDALVQALSVASRRRRRAGLVLVGTLGVAAVVPWGSQQSPRAPPCAPATADAELAGTWSDRRRIELRASVGPHPEAVEGAVDEWADGWIAQHVATCRARWHERTLSDRDLDARMACQRQQLGTLDAVLNRLLSDPNLATRSIAVVDGLPSPEACGQSVDAWDDAPADPTLLQEVAESDADRIAGRYGEAAHRALSTAEKARSRDHERLRVDALEIAGRALSEIDDERRFSVLTDAYHLANTRSDTRRSTRIANVLAAQYAYAKNLDEARTWLRHAEAGIARHPDDEQAIAQAHTRALIASRTGGRGDEAIESLKQVLARSRGETSSDVSWMAAADLVDVYIYMGRLDEAFALATRLHETTERELGRLHPRMARLAINLADIARRLGDEVAAIEHTRHSVDVAERVYGPINRRTAVAWVKLGLLMHGTGDFDGAEAAYTRALRAKGDVRDEWTSRILRGLGRAAADRGQYVEAVAYLEESVSVGRDVWRADQAELGGTRRTLAEIWIELGRLEEAEAELQRILADERRHGSPIEAARTTIVLATLAEHDGRHDEAAGHYESAVSDCNARSPPCAHASARMVSALLASGRLDEARAQPMATDADPRDDPDSDPDPVVEAARWLARAELARCDRGASAPRRPPDDLLSALAATPDFTAREQRRRLLAFDPNGGCTPPPFTRPRPLADPPRSRTR